MKPELRGPKNPAALQRRLDRIVRRLNRLAERVERWSLLCGLCVAVCVLGSGCATLFNKGLRLGCHGIDEGRVAGWCRWVESKSGRTFGDFRLTANATVTGHEAWAPSLGRTVGVFREGSEWDGMVGGTKGTSKSALMRLALATDGFFSDAYGQHEAAHALACRLFGAPDLPEAWKAWVPYWHP
jgi:hypothetical protein